jgi:CBS domain-containing protein
MLIRHVMNRRVVTTLPISTVKEACDLMAKNRIGSLVVVKEGKMIGILTERDVLQVVARGLSPETTQVADVMTTKVVTIGPDHSVEDAVDLMAKHQIKKLPVIEDDKLIGIVTASDIVVLQPKLIRKIASLLSVRLPAYAGG